MHIYNRRISNYNLLSINLVIGYRNSQPGEAIAQFSDKLGITTCIFTAKKF